MDREATTMSVREMRELLGIKKNGQLLDAQEKLL